MIILHAMTINAFNCHVVVFDGPSPANPPASAYAIRKAPGEHRLATAEAVAYLLNVLEPELDTRPIAHAMRTLVDKQLAQIPARLHRHYQ